MRKRKVTYPPKRSDRPAPPPAGAGPEPAYVRTTVASIDLRARAGRDGLPVGTRVRITGSGLYSGEAAVVESVAGGVISSVMVRTDSGRTRRVRTIDLEPITEEGRQPASPG